MTTMSTDPAVGSASAQSSPGGLLRWQKVIGILGLVIVFWVGNRLYDVIDAGGMGPGGNHQPGGTPTSQPTDNDPENLTPGGTDGGGNDGHDPSQFDH